MSGHSLEFPLVMDLQRRVCVPNKTPDGTEGEVLWRQLSAARMVKKIGMDQRSDEFKWLFLRRKFKECKKLRIYIIKLLQKYFQ
jgi:hypothetical protein